MLLLVAALLIHMIGYWTAQTSILVPGMAVGGLSKPYDGSAMTPIKIKSLKDELIRLMEEEKVYRESDLNLRKISSRLSTNTQYVSQLIHQEFDSSFSAYVNAYRIREARLLLQDKRYDHLSLLGIATEVGFNNSNTFGRVFKHHVGQTPSSFRKSVSQSNFQS